MLALGVQAWLSQAAGGAVKNQAAVAEQAAGTVSSSPKAQLPFVRLAVIYGTSAVNARLFQASICSPPSVA